MKCFIHFRVMASVASWRRGVLLVMGLFVVTRLLGLYLADHPEHYGTPGTRIVGDVEIYKSWADRIGGHGLAPYSEVPIEYPPGVLPFALAPTIAPEADYREAFIALMLLVDVAGLAGLMVIGRRRGSLLGAWLWVIGVAAIGPILYLRLDLIPAVATIWALERASARAWTGAGAWLGAGFIAKVYPVLLLPIMAIMAARKRAVVLGAAVVTVVALAPFVRSLGPLFESVVDYHAHRGLQLESTWSALVLLAGRFDYGSAVEFNFGAFHLASGVSPLLKNLADAATLAALAAGIAIAARARADEDPPVAETGFATLACILGLGTVFSPQFMVWVLALGAVVVSAPRSPLRLHALAIVPLLVLTQLIYPFAYEHLVLRDPNELSVLILLLIRDLGVLTIGLAGLARLLRLGRSGNLSRARAG